MPKMNKLDQFLTENDVLNAPELETVNHFFNNDFIKICDLVLDPVHPETLVLANELFLPVGHNLVNVPKTLKGWAYLIVVNNHVIKIGQTTNTFADRLSNYNCGKTQNRLHGTASVTNYFILQSLCRFLERGAKVEIYAKWCEDDRQIALWGKMYHTNGKALSKVTENVTISKYIDAFGTKPIRNVQK